LDPDRIFTQSIQAAWLRDKEVMLDVLRLDVLHPVVSGNKWFKLKYYLQDAQDKGCTTIATFGGAWSNHLVATAFACKRIGVQCVGFVRGEAVEKTTTTLLQCEGLGMELIHLSRGAYRDKTAIIHQHVNKGWYFINEGGYGVLGAKGTTDILPYSNAPTYTHIVASVGTGTMLAGLINSAQAGQHVVGISSLKGNNELLSAINNLVVQRENMPQYTLLHNYHFGGYGKHPAMLIEFINETWKQFELPLDIVYTGKLFYAIIDLIRNNFFEPGSKLLMIHSGGLQGNNSLAKNRLSFF